MKQIVKRVANALEKNQERSTMKKLFAFLSLSTLVVFLAAGSAWAYPFIEVEGFVNPWNGTWIENADGTTTITGITYEFIVKTADLGAEMDTLSLEFEGDIFTAVDNLTFLNPMDWTSTIYTSSEGNRYEFGSAGTALGKGDSLIFTVDATIYTAALTSVSGDFDGIASTTEGWSEGQIWGQSWSAGDTLGGSEGGSTAPVPEPTTILLSGLGLLGMGAYLRKRSWRQKSA